MFRINTYRHWPEDIGQTASTIGLCPKIDRAPYAMIATDISADTANPKTLFVTYCSKLSSQTVTGKRDDRPGIVNTPEWIVWYGDADGHAIDFPELAGKSPDVHPRFCGAGLI